MLVALVGVVGTLVVPYDVVETLFRKFGWIGRAADFLDTVAPGLETSHLLSFGALGFLARFSWPRARPHKVAIAIVAVAALIELVQLWVPGREAAISHALLEALGGLAGFGIAWVLTYAWGSGSLPEDYQASTHWSGENSDR
ncbi:VanZ family protein [Ramlibacter alkalitolerans]|uniref:VanZ family protein n=1 Tax=Ramlibacter alkalitolerans TaxID=2039631 RepID=A0ABS1JIW2_9BURK|nr:VanZ family protein [Ramlibacter alkalitolerans]MBL0424149.1 VanZ family protein [Ramlibacter alkalitolerans]